jgi:hypothetical protein
VAFEQRGAGLNLTVPENAPRQSANVYRIEI